MVILKNLQSKTYRQEAELIIQERKWFGRAYWEQGVIFFHDNASQYGWVFPSVAASTPSAHQSLGSKVD